MGEITHALSSPETPARRDSHREPTELREPLPAEHFPTLPSSLKLRTCAIAKRSTPSCGAWQLSAA